MRGTPVAGFVKPGFEAVREAFAENFERGKELGAAVCVYHRGEKVVDLWGGIRDRETGFPWEEDTMVLVFSSTKGLTGLAMALAHSRGLFDYEERVATYWPEFAQNGKAGITVRQLMSHQAGLFALDERPTAELFADPDRLAEVLARQTPAWEPGTRQAYHAITIGQYESELLRRVDPQHRTAGRFFQEEIADRLGIDFFISLPEEIPNHRLAVLSRPRPAALLEAAVKMPAFVAAAIYPRSRIRRALWGSEFPEQEARGRIYARNFEVPAGGGVGTARAIARAYSAFTVAGGELGLRRETLDALMAPPVPPERGFRDACLKIEGPFFLGFAKVGVQDGGEAIGGIGCFGAAGAGGSFGFADPDEGIGYGYVMNQMNASLIDPRDEVLRKAMYGCIREMGAPRGHMVPVKPVPHTRAEAERA